MIPRTNERNGLFWLVSAARETEGQTDWIGLDWWSETTNGSYINKHYNSRDGKEGLDIALLGLIGLDWIGLDWNGVSQTGKRKYRFLTFTYSFLDCSFSSFAL